MVQINRTPAHFVSLEAALRRMTVEERTPDRQPDSDLQADAAGRRPAIAVGRQLPAMRSPEPDPVAQAVTLWGRCGYVPSSRVAARDEAGTPVAPNRES